MDEDPKLLEIPRGALWEDVIHGAGLAGLLGALLFPTMGSVLHLAGQARIEGQLRGLVLSLMILALARLAWARVASLVVLDPGERLIHDAVRLGGTVYLQESLAFDQVEALVLARRERSEAPPEDGSGRPDPALEGRGEFHLGSGRVVPASNWVPESRELPSAWSRLLGQLGRAATLLELPLEERAAIDPPRWEARRYAAWIAAIAVTGGFLVVFAA